MRRQQPEICTRSPTEKKETTRVTNSTLSWQNYQTDVKSFFHAVSREGVSGIIVLVCGMPPVRRHSLILCLTFCLSFFFQSSAFFAAASAVHKSQAEGRKSKHCERREAVKCNYIHRHRHDSASPHNKGVCTQIWKLLATNRRFLRIGDLPCHGVSYCQLVQSHSLSTGMSLQVTHRPS